MTVTLTKETEIELTVFCNECEMALDFDFDQDRWGDTRVFVSICETCKARADTKEEK